MEIGFDMHPVAVFMVTMAASILVFSVERALLNKLHASTFVKRSFFNKSVDRIRIRGLPLISRYGLFGLAVFVAIPIPGAGVYAGTLLSWLMGLGWQASLSMILLGATVSNGIVTLSVLGIMEGINVIG